MSELRVCRQPEPNAPPLETTNVKYTYMYNMTGLATKQDEISDWITSVTLDNVYDNLCNPSETNSSCLLNLSIVASEERALCTVNALGSGCRVGPETLRVVHSQSCATEEVLSEVARVLTTSSDDILESFRENRSEILRNANDDDSSLTVVQLNEINFQLLEESSNIPVGSPGNDRLELTLGGLITVILSGIILLGAVVLVLVGCHYLRRGRGHKRQKRVSRGSRANNKQDKWQSYIAATSKRSLKNPACSPKGRILSSWFDLPLITVKRSATQQSIIDAIECGVSEYDSDVASFSDFEQPIKTKIRRIAIVPVETMVSQSGGSDTRSSSGESCLVIQDENDLAKRDVPFATFSEEQQSDSVETSLNGVDLEASPVALKVGRAQSKTLLGSIAENTDLDYVGSAPKGEQDPTEAVNAKAEVLVYLETVPMNAVRTKFGAVEIEAVRFQSMLVVSGEADHVEAIETTLNIEHPSKDVKSRRIKKQQEVNEDTEPKNETDLIVVPVETKQPFEIIRRTTTRFQSPSADCGLLNCDFNLLDEALRIGAVQASAGAVQTPGQIPKDPEAAMQVDEALAEEKVLDRLTASDANMDLQTDRAFDDCQLEERRAKSEPIVPSKRKTTSLLDTVQSHDTENGKVPRMVEAETWSSDSTEGITYDSNHRLLASELMEGASDADGMSHFEDFSESLCREDTVFSGSCTDHPVCDDVRSQEFKKVWSESDASTLCPLSEGTEGELSQARSIAGTEASHAVSAKQASENGVNDACDDHDDHDDDEEEFGERLDSLEYSLASFEETDVIKYVRTIPPGRNLPWASKKTRSIQL